MKLASSGARPINDGDEDSAMGAGPINCEEYQLIAYLTSVLYQSSFDVLGKQISTTISGRSYFLPLVFMLHGLHDILRGVHRKIGLVRALKPGQLSHVQGTQVMEEERMPKVNLKIDLSRLTVSDLHHMKRIERENLERVAKLKRTRFLNRITGTLLGLGVLGIYSYTIYAVKQEKFLDDFEEPEKISEAA